jgi:hypothetical protein
MSPITVIVFFWSSLGLHQSTPLEKVKVDDNITISIPADFERLEQSEINLKYVSSKQPLAVYSDRSRAADFSVNVAFSRWKPEDLEMMQGFYKSNIMGLYDEVRFIKESLEEVNGRRFVVFEFVSTVKPEEEILNNEPISKYTYIQYTIINYKTVLFHFNCPYMMKDQWSGIAGEIMKNVKIRNKI